MKAMKHKKQWTEIMNKTQDINVEYRINTEIPKWIKTRKNIEVKNLRGKTNRGQDTEERLSGTENKIEEMEISVYK